MAKDTSAVEKQEVTAIEIEEKILHILEIYPIISPTMLQGGIGAYLKPLLWRPVLNKMVKAGQVIETQESVTTPRGRYNSYTKLSLPGTKVGD